MNTGCDVVILGTGLIGMITACTIKALHPEAEICVTAEENQTPDNLELKISTEAVNVLKKNFRTTFCFSFQQQESIKKLTTLFEDWDNRPVKVAQMIADLTAESTLLGVKVVQKDDLRIDAARLIIEVINNPIGMYEIRLINNQYLLQLEGLGVQEGIDKEIKLAVECSKAAAIFSLFSNPIAFDDEIPQEFIHYIESVPEIIIGKNNSDDSFSSIKIPTSKKHCILQ